MYKCVIPSCSLVSSVLLCSIFSLALQQTHGWTPCTNANLLPVPGCYCTDDNRPFVTCKGLDLESISDFEPSAARLIHSLDLSDNHIDFSDPTTIHRLQQFKSLERLILSNNDIEVFDVDILSSQKETLRTLNLAYNKLRSVPEGIGELEELRILNMTGNKIKNLQSKLHLEHLQELYLDENPILRIRLSSLEGCYSLTTLHLSLKGTSRSTPVSGSMSDLHLPNFYSLHLGKSNLGKSPQRTLSRLLDARQLHLLYLSLEGCSLAEWQLRNIETESFESSLTHLSLARNDMGVWMEDVLSNFLARFVNLRYLDLSSNDILFPNTLFDFTRFPMLGSVILRSCKLTDFDTANLGPLAGILDLRDNILSTVNLTMTLQNTKRSGSFLTLYLSGNPWICDARLKWLRVAIDEQLSSFTDWFLDYDEIMTSLTCTYAGNKTETLIKDVPPKYFV